MQTTARPRKRQDTSSKFAVPNGAASSAVSVGPASTPQLPPADTKPKRRSACSGRNKSSMRLQKSDTTNKLKTLTQTKNARATAGGACEQGVEDEHVGDEEKKGPGNEAPARQTRCRPTEKRRRCEHGREGRRKEPGKVFNPALHAHLVAKRPQDVVAAQHEEEAGERPQRRSDLAPVDPDDAVQRGVREIQRRLDD